jgi:hypothetical protein
VVVEVVKAAAVELRVVALEALVEVKAVEAPVEVPVEVLAQEAAKYQAVVVVRSPEPKPALYPMLDRITSLVEVLGIHEEATDHTPNQQ